MSGPQAILYEIFKRQRAELKMDLKRASKELKNEAAKLQKDVCVFSW